MEDDEGARRLCVAQIDDWYTNAVYLTLPRGLYFRPSDKATWPAGYKMFEGVLRHPVSTFFTH